MAITLEQVDKLRERADVTFEEAKAALEHSGGDLLDALIWLERQGKTASVSGGFYSTRGTAPPRSDCVGNRAPEPERAQEEPKAQRGNIRDWIRSILDMGMENTFQVERGGKVLLTIPVLMGILLLAVAFYILVPLLVLGLFVGCRYHFSGPELGRDAVNQVMDKVTDTAEDIKNNVKQNWSRDGQDH